MYLSRVKIASTWATDTMARNHTGEIRPFRFRLHDVWIYANRKSKFVIKADGRPLPIYRQGMFLRPKRSGPSTVSELIKNKLADGYIFSTQGTLQMSKALDLEWQSRILGLYDEVCAILQDAHGYEGFAIYGSLLGAVREGGFIGHDVDFDMAYISDHSEGPVAADEMKRIAFTFIDHGFDVSCHPSALHIHGPDRRSTRIDLFHLYFDSAGVLSFPFGVAGEIKVHREQWRGVKKEVPFAGRQLAIPRNAEQVVEAIYGSSWRQPKPGFYWRRDRTERANEGRITVDTGQEVYWANFYNRTEFTAGSSFFDFVNAWPDTPDTVIDIGCGDGRDTFAFASAGRRYRSGSLARRRPPGCAEG